MRIVAGVTPKEITSRLVVACNGSIVKGCIEVDTEMGRAWAWVERGGRQALAEYRGSMSFGAVDGRQETLQELLTGIAQFNARRGKPPHHPFVRALRKSRKGLGAK